MVRTVCSLAAVALLLTSSLRAEGPLFERDVLPLLTKHCLGCHGGLKQQGKLDLRTIASALKGGKSGSAVRAGHAESSPLWKRAVSDDMPPGETKLTAAEKSILKDWVVAGLPTVAQVHKDDKPLLPADKKPTPREVAGAIDAHVLQPLLARKQKPAPLSADAEFLRRVTIDLTGRVPTAQEALAFLDSTDKDKRAKLIDRLLAAPEFGEQFGRTWRDWVCPPELPSDGNGGRQPHKEAQDFGRWLGERFAAGETWDAITRKILTVEGDIKNQPHVIFYGLVGQGGKITPDGTARAVASLFLGVQMQCAQCHDDPYRDWSQKEHWGLAAFFSQTSGDFRKVSESSRNKPQIVIPKSAFKNAGTNVAAALPRENGSGRERAGRKEFVDWLVQKDNPYFARAFANRLWFYFFSRGIVNPVDDLRDLNPPSHPALLGLLENEFRASGYDIKHLIRCICLSQTYQRTSRVAEGTPDAATRALTENFGRMPLRVMNADVLLDSLKLAYGDKKFDLRAIDPKDGNAAGESAPVADVYLEFLRRFGTNKDDATDFTHGIPQMLTLLNHPRLLESSKALEEHRKGKPAPSAEQTVEWLYLTTLSRRPTAEELKDALAYVGKKSASEKAYLGVLWMLINRSEYLLVR